MSFLQKSDVISVENFTKTYGTLVAVDNVSFEVYEGEIFGMVGPNGAGKTTTVENIEGLRKPDNGSIKVFGLNPIKDRYELRDRIGMQLQHASLPERIKVWEIMDLFSSIYSNSLDYKELLDQFGLSEKSSATFASLSGGQKQRLFIALSLINDPELVFMDELTTGLDPQARRTMWDLVKSIRDKGKTVFLTTHFMEEAETLCDRVAIIDKGKIIALDSPENMIKSIGTDNRVTFKVEGDFKEEELENMKFISKLEKNENEYTVYGRGNELLVHTVNHLAEKGYRILELRSEQSNLEDVYLSLTGKRIRD